MGKNIIIYVMVGLNLINTLEIKQMEYPFETLEPKWQKRWREAKVFQAPDLSDKAKYYVLSMFPIPAACCTLGMRQTTLSAMQSHASS